MSEKFFQRDQASPDAWDLIGAPETSTVALSTITTLHYADGSPDDTLPANTAAIVWGTADTTFDRRAYSYLLFTVVGSGTLSVIKHADLATLTDDYAILGRVTLGGVLPWQQGAGALDTSGGVVHLPTDCVDFPNHGEICNDTPSELHYTMDETAGSPAVHRQTIDAYVLPGGHEIQVVSASGDPALPTPSVAPTLATSGSSSWETATVTVVYTWTNGTTESAASPPATMTIGDGDGISVTVPSFPVGITGFYPYITIWQFGSGTHFYYADQVLADSPTVYLPLNDPAASSTCADLSGNGHSGTPTGVPSLGETLGCLRGGAAIEMHDLQTFDPDLGYVSTGDTVDIGALVSLPRTDSWTVEGWTYIGGVPSQAVLLVWGTPGDYNSLVAWQIFTGPTTFTVQATAGGAAYAANSSGAIGFTYHVAAVWDAGAGTMTLYVNGASLGSSALAPSGAGTFSSPTAQIGGPMNVGAGYPNTHLYSDAVMDDIALYPTALSAARILAHYRAGVQGVGRAALAPSSPAVVTALDATCAAVPTTGGLVARDPSGNLLWEHTDSVFTIYAPAGTLFATIG